MVSIANILGALLNALSTLGDMGAMLFDGLIWMIGMMTGSISILGNVLRFFPHAVMTSIVAVCGGLIVLRIFGRS